MKSKSPGLSYGVFFDQWNKLYIYICIYIYTISHGSSLTPHSKGHALERRYCFLMFLVYIPPDTNVFLWTWWFFHSIYQFIVFASILLCFQYIFIVCTTMPMDLFRPLKMAMATPAKMWVPLPRRDKPSPQLGLLVPIFGEITCPKPPSRLYRIWEIYRNLINISLKIFWNIQKHSQNRRSLFSGGLLKCHPTVGIIPAIGDAKHQPSSHQKLPI